MSRKMIKVMYLSSKGKIEIKNVWESGQKENEIKWDSKVQFEISLQIYMDE